ncbi:MAG: 3-phosphoshikimate 1-carboxyvinyltransferase [Hydrogenophilales bacterium CG03_land_8_20_14_0_80_62_28]|nr:MAG: 3-phosphoshikimate 1-carboxyvinyltransferase [Hydrogenophilales bacterium CG03_land_8_20_14_0_80_62_28]PIW39267.1 MAG: 3-phosphoshikimate 1-carboxyvinyltransferase [Hydrogenophilales bacterium CG15_BIG_FIL_POST_REV_8_21_14_020_62_31]PIW71763.1 MAG: 3-phosphoshikimate 1-carboxyvinyltransferase [Hydrogenophilales bacterium CG12_big_fil_rev_8_21_14_0_65_61_21]PIX02360.1 MAG: 3-phosphoshikimate 1-carboxyvinyltransferase [Hydrogenophilales bacterium CG_4_8_14_3_um_filter_62_83]PIY99401.1 MAG
MTTTDHIDLPAAHGARGTVRLPGSKSISNRVLLLAALAEGTTEVKALLDSDDTRVMLEALKHLGVHWTRHEGTDDYRVEGVGGAFPVKYANLFLGNAGTAFRSLTAACALAGGDYTLTGVPRMHERPIGDLVDALRQAGAQIDYLENDGYPPLHILPPTPNDGEIRVKGNVSSQYLTGLLLSAPLLGRAVTIQVEGELISKPYVEITLNLMRRFGVEVQRDGWASFIVPAATYQSPGHIEVEGDASSASYFLAAGAIGHGPVRVEGIGRDSIQGDVRFAEALARMGAEIGFGPNWVESRLACADRLTAIDLDCNHIPDAAMTLAILALFANGTTTLSNIASWRVKETDRIAAMAAELRKVGATVEEGADFIRVTPPAKLTANAVIDTYDDHRMAMCFSLVSLAGVPVRINNPKCTAKTFPSYWDVFKSITQ